MSAHSNDKSILGNGLNENVRSYLLERVIDFGVMGSVSTDAYYEIGTLPKGFVPRNIAVIELSKASASSTVKVYKTVEDASSGSATEIASCSVGGDTLGYTAASMLTVSGTAPDGGGSITSVSVGSLANAQLAIKAGSAFTAGRVKVAISGDFMTGIWDEGEKAPPIKPTVAIQKVQFAAGEHNLD